MSYKVIRVTELQRRFRSVFDEVVNDNVPYVLTRCGRPQAALIPYQTFLQLLAFKGEAVLAEFGPEDDACSRRND